MLHCIYMSLFKFHPFWLTSDSVKTLAFSYLKAIFQLNLCNSSLQGFFVTSHMSDKDLERPLKSFPPMPYLWLTPELHVCSTVAAMLVPGY